MKRLWAVLMWALIDVITYADGELARSAQKNIPTTWRSIEDVAAEFGVNLNDTSEET